MADCICGLPFSAVTVNPDGEIYACCPPWCSEYSFGNLFKQPFDEIWNGEKAKEFRKQFINNDFKYCNKDMCNQEKIDISPSETAPYPTTVVFCYDNVCNLNCIFCGNSKEKQDLSYFENNMDSILKSLLQNASNVCLSGIGEVFASEHSKKLIKRIAQLFPNIKFALLTNGTLCSKENIDMLGIDGRISLIGLSLHAVKKSTYEKMVPIANFGKVIENVEYVSSLKKAGKIDNFELKFVVNSINYKEMPEFIKLARKYGAKAVFLELLENEKNKDIYKNLAVSKNFHPEYNKYCKIIKNSLFKDSDIVINTGLINVQTVNKFKEFILFLISSTKLTFSKLIK